MNKYYTHFVNCEVKYNYRHFFRVAIEAFYIGLRYRHVHKQLVLIVAYRF